MNSVNSQLNSYTSCHSLNSACGDFCPELSSIQISAHVIGAGRRECIHGWLHSMLSVLKESLGECEVGVDGRIKYFS